MARRVNAGGGLAALLYSFRMARNAGGVLRFYKRMQARNTCKTCALGMGGQAGGMTNEAGHFPEVCKKSFQAQAGDMQPVISEEYFRTTPIELMQRLSSQQLENLGRLGFPLIAEPGEHHFRRVSWDDALDRAASAMDKTERERFFMYVSGRSSNEAAFLAQLMVRAYGSPNIHNCSYYCHQASGVGLKKVYGSGTASLVLEDLAKTDVAVVIGANPASNHPRLITQLMQLRRRGGKVIVINPIRELGLTRFRVPSDWRSMLFGSEIAQQYLQPRIGGDVALLKGILKGIIENDAVDRAYVEKFTDGFEAIEADARETPWETLVEESGISRHDIDDVVRAISGANRGILMWAMGLTHHVNGVDNILAVANVAIARGWLGRPGAGLLPIRGHSNVQGVGSVGVTPALKESFAQQMESSFNISIPREPGQDTYASMKAAERGDIDTALLFGGNLYGSNPDMGWAGRSLNRIGTVVHVSTKLNTGHLHGRGQTAIIMPVRTRDEEQQRTTQESMFNFVRVSEGGFEPPEGSDGSPHDMRSEVEVIAGLGERLLGNNPSMDWQALHSHQALRELIGKTVPGYTAIATVAEAPETASEFQLQGRTFHEPLFGTDNGRAHCFVTPLPAVRMDADTFRLMTLRSEGQFNTVVYDNEDLYRGMSRRDVAMLSPKDMEELGIEEGDQVTVSTEAGSLEVVAAALDITPGSVAMYYPEANVLVPQAIDPVSKTPAFKFVEARVDPTGRGARLPIALEAAS